MAELHFMIVLDTDTKLFRVGDLAEGPRDADEGVWDDDEQEWRSMDGNESDLYDYAEIAIDRALLMAEGILAEAYE